ncbi:MAG: SDR family oxidoreductase [Alphaproteobacteria bacterium]|nr:SDR family oxidoreductase [Alphaproteobacteria bacterium]MBV9693910.1 SDR family oxidoreductase [Alphaproteobacteria bacterium]
MSQAQHKQPPQRQSRQPGSEAKMQPKPEFLPRFKGADKLKGKVALITGGDSGIGRAVAVHMAREGADIAIVYLDEHDDAEETKRYVEREGRSCLLIAGDVAKEEFCREAVGRVIEAFDRLDVLVNNAAEQHEGDGGGALDISQEQLQRTFQTNIFGYFYMAKAALEYMREGAAIVNTASITAYKGKKELIDYSATKGAIVSFTRSLSQALVERKIRVNAVAPGPIWTPLIPASFDDKETAEHGAHAPMGRAGQPNEVAPCFVFLACEEASYMTGQVLHPNGGTVVNG